jgi:hypothetical protein
MGQEEAMQMAQQMMAEAEQQQMAQQQMAPQGMPPRQMAAFGGIMGLDGRRQYGLGSSLKKRFRKLIPNEVAKVAEVAAPFVAPFNPIAAGLMSGIGGFDRTGRIGSSIKSGLMNYGMGQAGRYLGGADFQGGFDPRGGFTEGTAGTGKFSKYFSKPTGDGGIKNLFNKPAPISEGIPRISGNEMGSQFAEPTNLFDEVALTSGNTNKIIQEQAKAFSLADLPGMVKKNLMAAGLGNNLMTGLLVGGLGMGALMGNMTEEEQTEMDRGEGMDIEGIRTEVIEAMKDPSGEKLKAIRIKYPFLGTQRSKNQAAMAMGGRIRRAEGGLMDLGGMEKDYRAEGGFVPIGEYEKKDDVPARLSVNEFVMTADAVRGAGQGDIDKGAEIMENVMKNLKQGGQMSEESQGMQGARNMFQTSQRLGDII